MYTIKQLADIAGATTRTLRYYDAINLLKPTMINDSGYRVYDMSSVDLLQQIMFYKLLGIFLTEIKDIIYKEGFDKLQALSEHKKRLLIEEKRIHTLIQTVDKSIEMMEGKKKMKDKEKFEGFKSKLIDENELLYGKEIRARYGRAVDDSINKLVEMDQTTYDSLEALTEAMYTLFKKAYVLKEPAGDDAQKACAMHEQWIKHYWAQYSKEAHLGLVELYVEDECFAAFYDDIQIGLAVFIRDAMKIYLK